MKKIFKKACAMWLIVTMIAGIAPSPVKAEEKTQTKDEVANNTYTENSEPQTDQTIQEEPTVLYELKDEREENVKQFLMSDHTIQAVMYSEPVHYKEDGEWKDIDNTLSLEKAKDKEDFDGYTNAQAGYNVKIADDASQDKLVRIEKDKYKIEFNLAEDQTTAKDNEPKAGIEQTESADPQQTESSSAINEDVCTPILGW